MFLKTKILPNIINRNFSPPYFSDSENQEHFEKYGYVILRELINEEEIQEAINQYKALQKMDGYNVKEHFESSGNFASKDIQQHIFKYIEKYIQKIAPRFANLQNCEIGDGGAFFIKPNTQKSILHPHQDSAVIDESKHYGVFVWIPLLDINLNNGPLFILPGSHLWGNFYRSQHIPWAFRNHHNFIWKQMKPLLVKKGDIICFDTSIIHGSGINYANEYRIVVCGALLPKNHQQVDYLLEGKYVSQYYIDKNYWLDGGKVSSLANYPNNQVLYTFPNPISQKELNHLLNH